LYKIHLLGVLALACSLACGARPAPITRPKDETAELRAHVGRQLALLPPPKGAVVVGVFDGKREAILGFGAVSANHPRTPDGRTVFEICSITKPMTGIVLADAALRHELSLDDEAQTYLPDERLPVHDGRPIRLVHLATYSAGFPWQPTNWVAVDKGTYTREMWRDFLANYTLTHAPGAGFQYGNVGFGVLGDVLSARAKKPIGAIFHERLFRPLRMTRSRLLEEVTDDPEKAEGVDEDGNRVPLDFDKALQPAACAVESTAEDLLRFVRAHLDREAAGPLASAIDTALIPRLRGQGDYADSDVGLGWFMRRADGVIHKNGSMKGYRSSLLIDRVRKAGAVVLAADATFHHEVLAEIALSAAIAKRDQPRLPSFATLPEDATPASARWEGGIQLVGIRAPSRVHRGGTASVSYFYRLSEKVPVDYRFFVHADVKGLRVSADHRPLVPLSDWPVDVIVEDRFALSVPADHPGGSMTLWTGMFRRDRLKVVEPELPRKDDRVRGTVIIVE
jgi:serine-type D-Ala-D-Ala carboxypeptidase/endopeptidase